jgi:TRAP-type C4-dicarboxylate transport system substrate-binding protein
MRIKKGGLEKMRPWKMASLALCVLFISFSFLTLSASGQAKAVELKYSIFFPAPAPQTAVADAWGKEIEKRTNGRVKVVMFPGGTLTPAPQCYDGVVKGISDIGMSVFAYTRGKFPMIEVADLPLGMKSGLTATKLVNEFNEKFKPKELDEVKVMYLHGHGPGILHTKKEVAKLEDLKGMKIRCTGLAAKIVTNLGGTPVAMAMGETYDALSRGVVEGSMAPYEALKTWKWGEVVKFTTEDWGSSYSSAFFVVMNKEKWNSLPPDVQKIIDQVNQEWIVKQGNNWDEIDKGGKEATLKAGNKIIALSKDEDAKWANAVKPILDEYVKNMKDKGLPGEEAVKFYQDRLKQLQ